MIFIHPITIIYIFLGLLFHKLNGVIYLYIFGLIHELAHVIIAKIFKTKTKEIVLLPTGFYAKIDDYSHINFFKQLFIVIAGPLAYFIILYIIFNLKKFNIISIYGYEECKRINNLILFINILPIYPLDGGKIIDLFLSKFCSEYQVRLLRIIFSISGLILLLFIISTLGDLFFLIFVFLNIIGSIINFKKEYFICLIKRKIMKNNYPIHINIKKKIYRFKNNHYIENKKIYDENKLIDLLIDEIKVNDN